MTVKKYNIVNNLFQISAVHFNSKNPEICIKVATKILKMFSTLITINVF